MGWVRVQTASEEFVVRAETSFDEHGYGLWALEIKDSGEFIGYTGPALQTFPAHFTPAVEVGWRLARQAWDHGYATEAACAALAYGFGGVGLSEVVSMTTIANVRSQRVMQRIGMSRDPADDFLYPNVATGSPIQPHVLHRIKRSGASDDTNRRAAAIRGR